MDKSQLVTIAVTAIITAFIKEIAGWLLSIAKNFAINTTVKEKIKKALTVNKITAVVNFVIMAFCFWEVYRAVYSSEPIDRFAIFNIAFFTCAGFANLLRLEIQWAIHQERTIHEIQQIARIERGLEEKHLDEAIARLRAMLDAAKVDSPSSSARLPHRNDTSDPPDQAQ